MVSGDPQPGRDVIRETVHRLGKRTLKVLPEKPLRGQPSGQQIRGSSRTQGLGTPAKSVIFCKLGMWVPFTYVLGMSPSFSASSLLRELSYSFSILSVGFE